MNREEQEQKITREFGSDCNGILLWIPDYQQYLAISKGNGTNDDSLCEGCNEYVYYAQYEYCNGDFEEVDGGQLDYDSSRETYNDNIITAIFDILDMAYNDMETNFVLLQSIE